MKEFVKSRPWVKWALFGVGLLLGYALGVLHVFYVLATGNIIPL